MNKQMINRYFQILLFLVLANLKAFSQKLDTVFYDNGQIRSVTSNTNGEKKLLSFFNKSQENLLDENNLEFTYFDSTMRMNRTVNIENKEIILEFWFNENDTIYRVAEFDESLKKNIDKYYKKLSRKLKYPKIARKNEIEGVVYLTFMVNKEGQMKNIKPLTRIGYKLEESAIKALNRNTNFGIVYLKHNPVNCVFRMPIRFRLPH
jgi:TonB family protein